LFDEAHAEHAVEPAGATRVAPHALHWSARVSPRSTEYLPASHSPPHCSGDWSPVAPENRPSAHREQVALEVRPVRLLQVPSPHAFAHWTTEARPIAALHLPFGHRPVHFDELVLPVVASSWYVPATHRPVHFESSVLPVALASSWYVPATHRPGH
jgi:hypothetical protein